MVERADIELADIEFDRALKRQDIMTELGYTPKQADKFMVEFGQRVGAGKERIIRQSTLRMMQLDGTVAKWVKANCGKGKRYDA